MASHRMKPSWSYRQWVPKWARTVDAAVWIEAPDDTIRFMNRRARRLFGVGDCCGLPCAAVVNAFDEKGQPLYPPKGATDAGRREGRPLKPSVLRIERQGNGPRWVLMLSFFDLEPGKKDPCRVHCAIDIARLHRSVEYLERVASRSCACRNEKGGGLDSLTPRERQILALLALDLDTYEIYPRLHISHATVRNHVQHILEKLEAHSVQEAVARYLIGDEGKGAEMELDRFLFEVAAERAKSGRGS